MPQGIRGYIRQESLLVRREPIPKERGWTPKDAGKDTEPFSTGRRINRPGRPLARSSLHLLDVSERWPEPGARDPRVAPQDAPTAKPASEATRWGLREQLQPYRCPPSEPLRIHPPGGRGGPAPCPRAIELGDRAGAEDKRSHCTASYPKHSLEAAGALPCRGGSENSGLTPLGERPCKGELWCPGTAA
jgi:hypothetical protein